MCNQSFSSGLSAASIVLCIGHSEACWQVEQMFERTWTICWDLKHHCYNINVLNFFFFLSFVCCLSLLSYDSKLMEKITHRFCILSDDVTVMTSSLRKVVCMFRIKFPTKRIFRIFPILRTDGMAPLGTYLWNDPRIIHSTGFKHRPYLVHYCLLLPLLFIADMLSLFLRNTRNQDLH